MPILVAAQHWKNRHDLRFSRVVSVVDGIADIRPMLRGIAEPTQLRFVDPVSTCQISFGRYDPNTQRLQLFPYCLAEQFEFHKASWYPRARDALAVELKKRGFEQGSNSPTPETWTRTVYVPAWVAGAWQETAQPLLSYLGARTKGVAAMSYRRDRGSCTAAMSVSLHDMTIVVTCTSSAVHAISLTHFPQRFLSALNQLSIGAAAGHAAMHLRASVMASVNECGPRETGLGLVLNRKQINRGHLAGARLLNGVARVSNVRMSSREPDERGFTSPSRDVQFVRA